MFIVVPRRCALDGGVETPMYKFLPYSLYNLTAAAECGRLMIHIGGVGRFQVDPQLKARPLKLLINAESAEVIWEGQLSAVLDFLIKRAVKLMWRRGKLFIQGNISRIDVDRLRLGLPVNIKVEGFIF